MLYVASFFYSNPAVTPHKLDFNWDSSIGIDALSHRSAFHLTQKNKEILHILYSSWRRV